MEITLGILFMIGIGVSWIATGIVMGRAPQHKLDAGALLICTTFLALVISLVIALMQGVPRCGTGVLLAAAASLLCCGIFNAVQMWMMSKAMQHGPNGIIWCLIQSGFVFPFLVGVLCFHAKCTLFNLAGLVALLLSLALMGATKVNRPATGAWKAATFIAFGATGLAQISSNLPSYFPQAEAVTAAWRSVFNSAGLFTGSLLLGAVALKKLFFQTVVRDGKRRLTWVYCIVLELLEVGGAILLLYPGMDYLARNGVGAIAYPLMVGACILGFELYALIFLHEKRTPVQLFALLLTLFGIIALCS